jgi:hypothetical protein
MRHYGREERGPLERHLARVAGVLRAQFVVPALQRRAIRFAKKESRWDGAKNRKERRMKPVFH